MNQEEIHQAYCEITAKYFRLRAAVFTHSRQTGHARCHEVDSTLYAAAGLPPRPPGRLPYLQEHRRECDVYRAALFEVPIDGEPVCLLRQIRQDMDRALQAIAAGDLDGARAFIKQAILSSAHV